MTCLLARSLAPGLFALALVLAPAACSSGGGGGGGGGSGGSQNSAGSMQGGGGGDAQGGGGGTPVGGMMTGTGGSDMSGGMDAQGGAVAMTGGAMTGGTTMGGAMTGGNSGTGGAAAFDACPAGMPCKVLLIGDALGAGVASKLNTKNMLTSDNHANWSIEGNANAFSTIIPATVTTNKPNIVVLFFGGEDVWNNTALAQAPARYLALVDKVIAAAPNALVIAVTPPALDPNWDQAKNTQWNFKAYNFENGVAKGIGDRANAGKHVALVRLFSLFAGQGINQLPANPSATQVNGAVSGMNAVHTGFNKYTLKDSGYMLAGTFINGQLNRHVN